MKKLIFLAMLLCADSALGFGFGPDKKAHFGTSVGYGLVAGTTVYHYAEQMGPTERMLTSSGLALVPGLAVEISDEFSKEHHFSWGDLTADALGAVTGAVAAELINGQLWISASGKQIRLVGKW